VVRWMGMSEAMKKAVERLAAVLDGLHYQSMTYGVAFGREQCLARAVIAKRSDGPSPESIRVARDAIDALGLVALPPELLVTRDQQEASNDEVTTLRSDARYLRGLALTGGLTSEDNERLLDIATKLELMADLLGHG